MIVTKALSNFLALHFATSNRRSYTKWRSLPSILFYAHCGV